MAPVKKPKPILGKHYLKEWREAKGVGQQEAATAIALSRTMLSKIENGENPYQQQYVEGLARLYRCSPAELIGTDPHAEPQDARSKLRAALLAYGVDRSQLELATGILGNFVPKEAEAPQEHTSSRDQHSGGTRRRVSAP